MFYYPEKDEGILIAGSGQLNCLNHLSHCEELQPRIDHLLETLGQVDLEALQMEYVRLFDYRPVCPPYETAYLQGRQKNQTVKNLKKLYRQAGLQCREEEAHDHVIAELEFMHYLYAQEDKDKENPLWKIIGSAFLEDHLLKWLPPFCKALQKNAVEPYQQLGHIVSVVIASEHKRQ
jgi:TorA maturation chaperone TorD